MDDNSEYERERVKVEPIGATKLKSGRPAKAIATTKLIQAYEIFQAICLEFGVTVDEMRGQSRSPNLRAARLEFCRRCAAAKINRPCMARQGMRGLAGCCTVIFSEGQFAHNWRGRCSLIKLISSLDFYRAWSG